MLSSSSSSPQIKKLQGRCKGKINYSKLLQNLASNSEKKLKELIQDQKPRDREGELLETRRFLTGDWPELE
ncbi:hypothetical protein NECAME_14045 [Necator americanus]|uniref:Uncharacterized protein n=1 Tax=Necator americanus TaxID=51031 RepID=W2SSW5_NECAM|nr:hypothetical protein NECAME_14045 [Necator americanus]ETN71941.1 hypothetical protein NECAME_14045 [Necator americanus]